MTDKERHTAAVTAVTVKLPPFWPSDPHICFTKFDHVVVSLSPEYATEVRDLILTPPTTNPYDTLKEELIKRNTTSEQRRLPQLFPTEELGNRKPTQLLRRMQQLLGDKAGLMDNTVLCELFLQRLPTNVRMVLASAQDKSTTLNKLAQLADKVIEVTPLAATVSTVNTAHLADKLEQLHGEVSAFTSSVKSIHNPQHTKGAVANKACRGADQSVPNHQKQTQLHFVGITLVLEIESGNAAHPALQLLRETTRPATNGDKYHWPATKSPFLHQW